MGKQAGSHGIGSVVERIHTFHKLGTERNGEGVKREKERGGGGL